MNSEKKITGSEESLAKVPVGLSLYKFTSLNFQH